jgi:hypothetical protein
MHDLVIGLFMNRYDFGLPLSPESPGVKQLRVMARASLCAGRVLIRIIFVDGRRVVQRYVATSAGEAG